MQALKKTVYGLTTSLVFASLVAFLYPPTAAAQYCSYTCPNGKFLAVVAHNCQCDAQLNGCWWETDTGFHEAHCDKNDQLPTKGSGS